MNSLEMENKFLKEAIKIYMESCEVYKERIDKAIDYINKELCNINVQENIMLKNELLKIKSKLQGVDKE